MTAPTTRHSAVLTDNLHRGWLLDRLALYLDRPAGSIDPTVPLAEFGMDSVAALSLCGDLEDQFGLYVHPTLLWDHPTVESLVGWMAVEIPPVVGDDH